MSDYFKYFPKTTHNDRKVVDITKRTKIHESINGEAFVFLPYTVTNDDRPEHIAEFYYGSADLVWLVYYANNIVDMYSQWPKSAVDFDEDFKKRYEELSGTTGYGVIAWGLNEQLTNNIVFYQNIADPTIRVNQFTYDNVDTIIASEWRAIRYYEYETILNDNKRNIYLVDNRYTDRFKNDMRAMLNE